MNQKSVLITGGAGFIGSHLCERFLKNNWQVICLDNLITGQEKNIEPLKTSSNFTFINADVIKPTTYAQQLTTNKLQLILHFASPAGPNPHSPKSYLKYPIETYLVNSIGTHYLLELAQKTGAEFLFASTSEVYGNPLQHPQAENYLGNVNTLGPRACYDEAKRFGEMATVTYGKKYGLKTKIVRIFNTYGPRMNLDDGRVVPQFVFQALQNQPITIYGNGEQTSSLCYIDDLVAGIYTIILKAKPYEVFNLGSDEEITINYLAKTIKDLTNSSSSLAYKDLPEDDPEKRKPDLTKIKTQLGWQPKITLKNGLKKTITWFKKSQS